MQIENLDFQLPDPNDRRISEPDFNASLDTAWQVCDRFDLQTDIWRGRILRAVRDRETSLKGKDENTAPPGEASLVQSTGFLNWLKDREISKSRAYAWIELADSADKLFEREQLEPEVVERFSKRAFIETAQASPEVQQMITEAARNGDHITRREVRDLSNEWTTMSSDLLTDEIKEKAAANMIPMRYLAPLVKEMEKLPEEHQTYLRQEIRENHDIDSLKQVTAEAQQLSKYLNNSSQIQALDQALERTSFSLEGALAEALRIGSLKAAADLVNYASQLEQAIAKLYTTSKRFNSLMDKLYVDSGASTPNLRSLLSALENLAGEKVEITLGSDENSLTIRLQIEADHNDTDYNEPEKVDSAIAI